MAVLVIADHDNAALKDSTHKTVTAAQAFGGDTANLTLSARLRGLSPNHTLVLVNGKRRHGTANLAVLGGPSGSGLARSGHLEGADPSRERVPS